MRYRLRTLLILLATLPPVLAFVVATAISLWRERAQAGGVLLMIAIPTAPSVIVYSLLAMWPYLRRLFANRAGP